jgi:hypothetical protein
MTAITETFPTWVVPHAPFRYHFYKHDYSGNPSVMIPSSELFYISFLEEYDQIPSNLIKLIRTNAEAGFQRFVFEVAQDFTLPSLAFSLLSYNLAPNDPFQKVASVSDIGLILNQDESFRSYFDDYIAPVYKRLVVAQNGIDNSTAYYTVAQGDEGYLHIPVDGTEYMIFENKVSVIWSFYITSGTVGYDHTAEILRRVGCCPLIQPNDTQAQEALVSSLREVLSSYSGGEALNYEFSVWFNKLTSQLCILIYHISADRFEQFLQDNNWNVHVIEHYKRKRNDYAAMNNEIKLCYFVLNTGVIAKQSSSFFGML